MAWQQAQLLLNVNSLEPVNFGVQQNNTEAFAVALCHLAELHAEQVYHMSCNLCKAPLYVFMYIHLCLALVLHWICYRNSKPKSYW